MEYPRVEARVHLTFPTRLPPQLRSDQPSVTTLCSQLFDSQLRDVCVLAGPLTDRFEWTGIAIATANILEWLIATVKLIERAATNNSHSNNILTFKTMLARERHRWLHEGTMHRKDLTTLRLQCSPRLLHD